MTESVGNVMEVMERPNGIIGNGTSTQIHLGSICTCYFHPECSDQDTGSTKKGWFIIIGDPTSSECRSRRRVFKPQVYPHIGIR